MNISEKTRYDFYLAFYRNTTLFTVTNRPAPTVVFLEAFVIFAKRSIPETLFLRKLQQLIILIIFVIVAKHGHERKNNKKSHTCTW